MQGTVASLLNRTWAGEDGLNMEFKKICANQIPGFQAPEPLHFLQLGRSWEVFCLESVRADF